MYIHTHTHEHIHIHTNTSTIEQLQIFMSLFTHIHCAGGTQEFSVAGTWGVVRAEVGDLGGAG